MKCWNRSTLGVVVGVINVLFYVVATILLVIGLFEINDKPSENVGYGNVILGVLLFICVVMAILSALLIRGIIKRRHSLMTPWLVTSVIGLCCFTVAWIFVSYIIRQLGLEASGVLIIVIIGLAIIGLQVLFLYTTYTLYRYLRAKVQENSLQMVTGE